MTIEIINKIPSQNFSDPLIHFFSNNMKASLNEHLMALILLVLVHAEMQESILIMIF